MALTRAGNMKLARVVTALAVLAGTQAFAGEKSIRIGVLGDQSGVYADLGGPGSVLAAQMAADDYGGKVLGKPIEIVSADLLNKPDVAAAIARRWDDVAGVDAITAVPLTSVAPALQHISREIKQLCVVSHAP